MARALPRWPVSVGAFRAKATSAEQLVMVAGGALAGYVSVAWPDHGQQPAHQARARHVGNLVTVLIEDTRYQILHGEKELAIKPRRDTTPINRLYGRAPRADAPWPRTVRPAVGDQR